MLVARKGIEVMKPGDRVQVIAEESRHYRRTGTFVFVQVDGRIVVEIGVERWSFDPHDLELAP